MHPLSRYLVPLGIGFLILALLWWIAGPVITFLKLAWPLILLAIVLGIVIWRWRKTTEEFNKLVKGASENPLISKIFNLLVLTLIYGLALWGLSRGAGWVQSELGVSNRWAWVIVAILGLPFLVPALWNLYSGILPGDKKAVRAGLIAASFVILVFLGWWYHHQPARLFDEKTGRAQAWYAEKEGKIYYYSTDSVTVKSGPLRGFKIMPVYYSPVTGEGLRLVTREDARKLQQESWLKKGYRSMFPRAFAERGTTSGSGSFTFPDGVDQIEVPLHSTKWSGQVITPPGSIYRIDPPDSGWVQALFWDGSRAKFRWGEEVKWVGVKRGIFRLTGSEGIAAVSIERR